MNKIYFSTGNERKIKEARAACDLFGIEVVPLELNFNEIQSHDPIAISAQKVEDAYRLADKPAIVVADTSWSIPSLNGFRKSYNLPGTRPLTPAKKITFKDSLMWTLSAYA
jgi:inosine/xanthosine triphosphate pyrophosphatase family protein